MKTFKKLVIGVFVTIMALAALIVVVDQPLMLSTDKSDLPPRLSAPPPPQSVPQEMPKAEAKISVGSFLDIEWSEGNSWSTVFKLLVIILGTFLGIKTINAVFRRFE